jgi:hypothetical protein
MTTLFTTCGVAYQVDDDIAQAVGHLAWKLDKHGYVYRKTTINGRRGRSVRLHRVVAGVSDPAVYVDHIDGDQLNCLRSNLRPANAKGSSQNRGKYRQNSSQFKGVVMNGCRWIARIKADGRQFHLGTFDDEHEAAHEYNKAAIRLHGEFARLNPVGSSSTGGGE